MLPILVEIHSLLRYVVLALLIRISDTTARSLHEVPDSASVGERFAVWRLRRAAAA
jgi:hypothetical protein